MSGATSITSLEAENVSRAHNIAAINQGQCTPMPLPSLGTQRIDQGNGTNVGTIISLQCPEKHRLMGGRMECVMSTNTTQWVGETYCRPVYSSEEFGFHVAVLASIVSSAIIMLLSMAFITCYLHERFKKKKKRRKQKREAKEEDWLDQRVGGRAGNPHHHSRNNNNNSHQKAVAPRWGGHGGTFVDNKAPCRSSLHPYCHLTVPSSTPLPGYNRCPVTRDIRLDQDTAGPLQNSPYLQHTSPALHGPPCQMACGAQKSGPAQTLAACSADGRSASVVRQFGVQEHRMPLLTQHPSQESYMVNSNKECSIRIISV